MADMNLFLLGKGAGNLFRAPILFEVMFNSLFHSIGEPNMFGRLLAPFLCRPGRLPGTITTQSTVAFELTIKSRFMNLSTSGNL